MQVSRTSFIKEAPMCPIEDVLVQSGLGSLLVPFGVRSTTVVTAAALEAARKGRREATTKDLGPGWQRPKKADKTAKNFIFTLLA